MKRPRVAVLILIASLGTAWAAPADAEVRASVGLGFFYDNLTPHGEWISSAEFGYVWRPVHVYAGWRPYHDGYWVYTDYGWTFVSDEPWGWATYHYGRWYLDPFAGWVWVPGYAWAPAWVIFHKGGGYVGWAPLPPNVRLGLVIGGGYRIDPRSYCFVEERHFVDRRIRHRVLPLERNLTLVRSTVNVTHYSRAGDVYANRSLSTDRIERATRARIERRRIVDVSDRGRAGARVEDDRVAVFRPQVSRRAAARPRHVVDRDQRRGQRIELDRERPLRRDPPARIERRDVPTRPRGPITLEGQGRQVRWRIDSSRGPTRERANADVRRSSRKERVDASPERSSRIRSNQPVPPRERDAHQKRSGRRPLHDSGRGA